MRNPQYCSWKTFYNCDKSGIFLENFLKNFLREMQQEFFSKTMENIFLGFPPKIICRNLWKESWSDNWRTQRENYQTNSPEKPFAKCIIRFFAKFPARICEDIRSSLFNYFYQELVNSANKTCKAHFRNYTEMFPKTFVSQLF